MCLSSYDNSSVAKSRIIGQVANKLLDTISELYSWREITEISMIQESIPEENIAVLVTFISLRLREPATLTTTINIERGETYAIYTIIWNKQII